MSKANSTSFKSGKSGNPSGRPKLSAEEREARVAALAAKSNAMPAAVAVLVGIAENTECEPRDRIAAAKVLLEGLEKTQLEITGADGGPITTKAKYDVPSAEFIAAFAARITRDAALLGVGSPSDGVDGPEPDTAASAVSRVP